MRFFGLLSTFYQFFSSKQKASACKLFILFLLSVLPATTEPIVNISDLSSRNFVFSQYQDEVQLSNKAWALGKKNPLLLFGYKAKKTDSIISVAARCSIRQETLATVNAIDSADQDITGKQLYLPSADGIFISQPPQGRLQVLLAGKYGTERISSAEKITLGTKKISFLRGEKLSPSERAFFLSEEIVFPLEKYTVSSEYGIRNSPISGRKMMHGGIDLAAKKGSVIKSCKSGTIVSAKTGDPVFGNCVEIEHSGGIRTFYAHMEKISVEEGQNVSAGTPIGTVGTTGLSTGPHLHFEVKVSGRNTDPLTILKK